MIRLAINGKVMASLAVDVNNRQMTLEYVYTPEKLNSEKQAGITEKSNPGLSLDVRAIYQLSNETNGI